MRATILLASFTVALVIIASMAFLVGQNSATKTATITITRYSSVTQSSSSSSYSSVRCVRTGEGWAFYVRVMVDGTGKPISGAEVRAISYTKCLPFTSSNVTVTDTTTLNALTPYNGTISLPTIVQNYSIWVTYQGTTYSVLQVAIPQEQITNVTFSFPSGNILIAHSYPPH